MTRTLAILIFDDVEVLDFCGPFEVFSVANYFDSTPAFRVLTVAEKPGPVAARNGLSVNPHVDLARCPSPDILLVPGGQGTRREIDNASLIKWIRDSAIRAELVLSVCTGALMLGRAGILDGLAATTHHKAFELLRQCAPKTEIRTNQRVVDNGRVICSAGIAAGIDISLLVVGRLLGDGVARQTAEHMEYPWGGAGE